MAYRAITTLPFASLSNDADFRLWGLMVHDALVAMGLIQTSDTGQINWTTVTRPVGSDTVAGYEIWRFADALQATAPVFFKLEYGSGNGAAGPSIWLTVGSGSNGTGSISGLASTRTQSSAGNISNAFTHSNFFSGDTNRFFIAGNFYAPSNHVGAAGVYALSVERELSAAGAVVGTGCYIVYGRTGSMSGGVSDGIATEYWSRTAGGLGKEVDPGIHVPGWVNSNGLDGPNVSMFPCYFANGALLPFGLQFFAYFNTTIPANQQVTFNVYGAAHTYYTLGSTFVSTIGTASRGGPVGVTWMARYDP